MEYAPDLLHAGTSAVSLPGRRLHHRQKLATLTYVQLNHSNGGIVRDLSEAGLALQSVSPLRLDQQVQLRFDLLRPRLHVETTGRVAWADERGQAGVQFLNLPERSRRSIKQWTFTQLLARAHQLAEAGFVFCPEDRKETAAQLLFSSPPRAPIALQTQGADASSAVELSLPSFERSQDSSPTLRFDWFPLPLAERVLARIVDGLILVCALLLFSVIAIAVTETFPAWPVAAALALLVTCVFGALYWFLFAFWEGSTPGARLAEMASRLRTRHEEMEEAERPRFR